MAKITFGRVNIGTSTDEGPQPIPQPGGGPFKLLILGDFSGRRNRPAAATTTLQTQKPRRVDPDNLDGLPGAFKAGLELPLAGLGTVSLTFDEIDDFHPDALYQRLPQFQTLEELRERLDNPDSFPQAMAEFTAQFASSVTSPAETSTPDQPSEQTTEAAEVPKDIDPADLLSQILGDAPSETSKPGGASSTSGKARSSQSPEIESLVKEVMAPHLVPGRHAEQDATLEDFNDVVSAQMRQVLHHPDFQQLESAWRSLDWLVRRLEIDGSLQVELLDVTKEELAKDLASAEDFKQSALYAHCVTRPIDTPGGEAYAALIGNYSFAATEEDAMLLHRVSQVAQAAGAPLLTGAGAGLAGLASFDEAEDDEDFALPPEAQQAWDGLRQQGEARFVALTAPRFLLRHPYSQETYPVEEFPFEEQADPPQHALYLWANGAFAYAALLGQAFMQSGWNLRPAGGELSQLPVHVYREDGTAVAKPCSEVLLTQGDIERWVEQGLSPLAPVRGTDRILLPRLQSYSAQSRGLAGRWG